MTNKQMAYYHVEMRDGRHSMFGWTSIDPKVAFDTYLQISGINEKDIVRFYQGLVKEKKIHNVMED